MESHHETNLQSYSIVEHFAKLPNRCGVSHEEGNIERVEKNNSQHGKQLAIYEPNSARSIGTAVFGIVHANTLIDVNMSKFIIYWYIDTLRGINLRCHGVDSRVLFYSPRPYNLTVVQLFDITPFFGSFSICMNKKMQKKVLLNVHDFVVVVVVFGGDGGIFFIIFAIFIVVDVWFALF